MSFEAVDERDKKSSTPINVNAQTGITVTLQKQTINIPLKSVNYETLASFFDVKGKEIFLYNTNGKQMNKLLRICDAQNGTIADGDTVRIVAKPLRERSTDFVTNPNVISTSAAIVATKKGVTVCFKEQQKILPLACVNFETIAALFDLYRKQIFLYNKTKNVLVKIDDAQNGLISDGDEVRVVARKHIENESDRTLNVSVTTNQTVDGKGTKKKSNLEMINESNIDTEAKVSFQKGLKFDAPKSSSWLSKYITETPMFCNNCRCMVSCYSFISKYGFGKTKCKSCHQFVTENYIVTLIRTYIDTFGFDNTFLQEYTNFFENLRLFDY